MRPKNKKTFELSSTKKYKQYERKLWLIPLACLLFTAVSSIEKAFDDFIANPGIATLAGIILFLLLDTMVLSIFPFFVGEIIIRAGLKSAIQNCTITSMQDFDYYRDKLTGLSPATISILTDLEVEQKKDVAASILQYENLGLLAEKADHTYYATPKYYSCNDLNESDRYLIEHLEKGDFDWENDTQWKQLAMDEAIAEGYIANKSMPWQNQQTEDSLQPKKGTPLKGRLIKLLLAAIWVCWLLNASPRIVELQPFFTVAPGTSLEEHMNLIYSQPELFLKLVEMFALGIAALFIIYFNPVSRPKKKKAAGSSKGCLVPLVIVLVWFGWALSALPRMNDLIAILDTAPEGASFAEQAAFLSQPKLMLGCIEVIALFIYTMFIIAHVIAVFPAMDAMRKNRKSIKRTDYGNQMAECVYGMKNFIHDYSNLNIADKRQVALWEDYLVYAVVLEENEEIVKEISRMRREVL